MSSSRCCIAPEFHDIDVRSSSSQAWSIVVRPPELGDASLRHPLGRTLYVHPVTSVEQVIDHVGPGVQTVAVYPGELGFILRDALARRGVSRIAELGMNNVFRVGGAHDGMYPTQRLVRLVSMEMPAKVAVKGIVVPIDQTTFLLLMLEELLGACEITSKPVDPPFEALMEQSLIERRLQRGEPQAAAQSAGRATCAEPGSRPSLCEYRRAP